MPAAWCSKNFLLATWIPLPELANQDHTGNVQPSKDPLGRVLKTWWKIDQTSELRSLSVCIWGCGSGGFVTPSLQLCGGTALTPATCESLHLLLVRVSATLKTYHQSLSHLPQYPPHSTSTHWSNNLIKVYTFPSLKLVAKWFQKHVAKNMFVKSRVESRMGKKGIRGCCFVWDWETPPQLTTPLSLHTLPSGSDWVSL